MTSKFIKSIAIDILVFVAIIVIIFAISSAVNHVISTDVALEQMENSNDAYIMMSVYNKIPQLTRLAYSFAIVWYGYTIVRDIYNYFINNKKEKN